MDLVALGEQLATRKAQVMGGEDSQLSAWQSRWPKRGAARAAWPTAGGIRH